MEIMMMVLIGVVAFIMGGLFGVVLGMAVCIHEDDEDDKGDRQ